VDRDESKEGTEERERQPSLVFGIFVITFGLAYVAIRSPHPLTATGLALMTGSGLIATPDLLRGILEAGSHPKVLRFASAVARTFRRISLVIYGLLAFFVLVVAVFGQPHVSQAVTASFVAGVVVGVIELIAWEIRLIASELVSGGRVDRQIAKRFGAHRRWPLAGVFFLAGTVVQLIATFVE
jgi:hypothetical protein